MGPGEAAKPPGQIPTELKKPVRRYELFLVLHPKCPCAEASLSELSKVASVCGEEADITVLLVQPGEGSAWKDSKVIELASSIPNVDVVFDAGGTRSKELGCATSGQALLYAPTGQLVFSGGITASRAHAGDNDGRIAVVDLIRTGTSKTSSAPVYGCELGDLGLEKTR